MNNNGMPQINPMLLNPQWVQYQKSLSQIQNQKNHPQPLMGKFVSNEIDFSSKMIRLDQKNDLQLIEEYFGQKITDLEPSDTDLKNLEIEIQSVDYKHGLSSSVSSIVNMGRLSNDIEHVTEEQEEKKEEKINSQLLELMSSHPKRPPVKIEQLLLEPHRERRPHKLVIILRGPPGSGKSFIANLIKQEEEKHVSSSDKPKYLSIDNYFISEQETSGKNQILMKYEYDKEMDEAYQKSLVKSFKKIIDDDLFNFIIVDMINERKNHIEEMFSHATLKAFQVYVADLNFVSAETCFSRNVHNRTLEDVKKIKDCWETLPDSYLFLDVGFFVKEPTEIRQVEMEDG
ncbi:ylp motif-containing 1 [Brachionus plicatilis]|uniref:Ylp motif-containing 1 n=1 Tax=Brachionus plicatilis TaxID=10195 RepID=A0A3M7RVE1_BRAPC|nr:ylp motif-containing 1 [Brachionus plicatilis]